MLFTTGEYLQETKYQPLFFKHYDFKHYLFSEVKSVLFVGIQDELGKL